MHVRIEWASVLGGFAVLLGGMCDAHATAFSTNLLLDPGAESAVQANANGTQVPIPNWNVTGSFTAVPYVNNFPTPANLSASIGGGQNFFAGGPSANNATASQVISIADIAAAVDAGAVSAALSAFLGGFGDDGDNMTVIAKFLDASSAQIASLTIGPVTSTDRGSSGGTGGITELLQRSGSLLVPVNTRSIEVDMLATFQQGAYNDGYADNLSLSLTERVATAVPEPGTLTLAGTALLGFGWLRRRRAR